MLTPLTCRAARALLEWKLEDLAHKSGLALTTVSWFERGRPPRVATVQKLTDTLTEAGIEFVDREARIGVTLLDPLKRAETRATSVTSSVSLATRLGSGGDLDQQVLVDRLNAALQETVALEHPDLKGYQEIRVFRQPDETVVEDGELYDLSVKFVLATWYGTGKRVAWVERHEDGSVKLDADGRPIMGPIEQTDRVQKRFVVGRTRHQDLYPSLWHPSFIGGALKENPNEDLRTVASSIRQALESGNRTEKVRFYTAENATHILQATNWTGIFDREWQEVTLTRDQITQVMYDFLNAGVIYGDRLSYRRAQVRSRGLRHKNDVAVRTREKEEFKKANEELINLARLEIARWKPNSRKRGSLGERLGNFSRRKLVEKLAESDVYLSCFRARFPDTFTKYPDKTEAINAIISDDLPKIISKAFKLGLLEKPKDRSRRAGLSGSA